MKNKKSIIILLVIVIIGIASCIIIEKYFDKKVQKSETSLKIHFFNAGKADAFIITKNDKTVIIDTGEKSLSKEMLNYLKENKISKIDYLIITHFDKDHVGGAANIIDNMNVLNVLQSNVPKESKEYNNYIDSLNSKNIEPITVLESYSFELGDVQFNVNGPNKVYNKNESNNSSLITSIDYGDNSFLFMGDAENDRIKDFTNSNSKTYDFIKIPYHGNYQKELDNLLQNTKPKYAVVTSSDDELEEDKMINLLNDLKIKYYLTRIDEITLISDDKNINISYDNEKR